MDYNFIIHCIYVTHTFKKYALYMFSLKLFVLFLPITHNIKGGVQFPFGVDICISANICFCSVVSVGRGSPFVTIDT